MFNYLYFCQQVYMDLKSKITFSVRFFCIICISIFAAGNLFAQKADTTKISLKPKPKVVSRVPQIKGSVTPYKPGNLLLGNSSLLSSGSAATHSKTAKVLTILKIYPNPVSEQFNINLRLDKESNLFIKITDLLGNDITTLINERSAAGEHTKTFTIPSKLNPGIYFVRIDAGGDLVVKRIVVL